MLRKKMLNGLRSAVALAIGLASVMALNACSDVEKVSVPSAPDGIGVFDNLDSVAVDVETGVIELPQGMDSLVVSSLASLGGKHFFIALDDDPVDPAFDWDNPLKPGSVISLKDNKDVRVVALDDNYRVVKIWTISKPEEDAVESSSSEEKIESSSSEEVVESSSSDEGGSSSDEETVSSSSVEESSSSETSEEPSSSASVEISSSSEETSSSSTEDMAESSSSETMSSSSTELESSSSEVEESSSSETIEASSSSEMVVSSSSVEPESSSSEVEESSSSKTVESSSSSEAIVSSSSEMLDNPQLPGSDFSSWDKSFWGSTSDAMAKEDWNTAIHLYSGANLNENGSSITLTSQVVYGSGVGKKLAGGFYFAGEYSGTSCDDIYNADGGYPGLESSNLTGKMNFGRPFTARPKSFDVTYSYKHVAGKDDSHPQMSLIYVMLVSADNKVVASGMITDTESVENVTRNVELQYGHAPEILISETFAVQKGLTQGDGTEDVATIHVMFASSAHAHVASNGSSSWRGGDGSQLTLENFKLNY